MSTFKVSLTAINPKDESKRTPPVEAMVDTGSEYSWLPKALLLDAGITPKGKRRFYMANQQHIEREYGYALLAAADHETPDQIIFAESSDMSLLGVHTIEGFCVAVDNVGQRFIDIPAVPTPANVLA